MLTHKIYFFRSFTHSFSTAFFKSEIYNYQKKKDIKNGHEGDRFPIYADPCPFPLIEIDPAILNCVHRNAITNAMKYGEEGGLVETIFIYHDKGEKFELQVVNRPGQQHEDIMKLGTKKANEMLFSPGKSLHRIENRHSWDRSFSSGDGKSFIIIILCTRLFLN